MKNFLIWTFIFFPSIAAAQETDISNVLNVLYEILVQLVPLLITLALVFFLYGVAKFILFAGDSEKRKEGLKLIVFGIIGLFVMVSVWGLVAVLQNTFGIGAGGGATVPGLEGFFSF